MGRFAANQKHTALNIKREGASGLASGNDTNAWLTAIAKAKAVGPAHIVIPSGVYNISQTVVIDFSQLTLEFQSNVTINWTGASGGTLFRVTAISGAGNTQIFGVQFKGMPKLRGNNQAARLLEILSANKCTFEVDVAGATDAAIYTGVVATLLGARDTQNCNFKIVADNVAAAGNSLVMDGDSTATSLDNTIWSLMAVQANVPTVLLKNAEYNIFVNVKVVRQGTLDLTKLWLDSRGGATSSTCARNNTIGFVAANCSMQFGGTDTYTVASTGNFVKLTNNPPLAGPGATVTWADNSGKRQVTECGDERVSSNVRRWYGVSGTELVRHVYSGIATASSTISHGAGFVSENIVGSAANTSRTWSLKGSSGSYEFWFNNYTTLGPSIAVDGFYQQGTKVVGARISGWGAPTGTAARTTFATYAAPTASGTYSQAEMQAVMNALQITSQRLKALIDDLRTHGLLGD